MVSETKHKALSSTLLYRSHRNRHSKDIFWDIGYAKTWDEATLFLSNLYFARPPLEAFLEWRDLRVMDEAHWYG